jgi:hypothetical protein
MTEPSGREDHGEGVWLSFALKKRMAEDEPLVTVKLEFPAAERFDECLARRRNRRSATRPPYSDSAAPAVTWWRGEPALPGDVREDSQGARSVVAESLLLKQQLKISEV